jgi:hypothetical protein
MVTDTVVQFREDRAQRLTKALAEPPQVTLRDQLLKLKRRRWIILGTVAVSLRLTPDEGPRRTGLVASQIIGVVVARYLLRFEPMASMSADELADAVGPTIQRYLTGPMSAPDGTLETQG